jgi:hypothetical protein
MAKYQDVDSKSRAPINACGASRTQREDGAGIRSWRHITGGRSNSLKNCHAYRSLARFRDARPQRPNADGARFFVRRVIRTAVSFSSQRHRARINVAATPPRPFRHCPGVHPSPGHAPLVRTPIALPRLTCPLATLGPRVRNAHARRAAAAGTPAAVPAPRDPKPSSFRPSSSRLRVTTAIVPPTRFRARA